MQPNSEDANPEHDIDSDHAQQLGAADADALDALIDAGYDFDAVPPPLRPRAERVAAFLGLLDCPADPAEIRERRIAQTTRFAQISNTPSSSDQPAELSVRDNEALETLVMSGFRPDRVPASLQDRARRHLALAELVTIGSQTTEARIASGRRDLIDRTEALARARADQPPLQIDDQPAPSRGFRLSDLASAAAMIALMSMVVLPMLGSWRQQAMRDGCLAHLHRAAQGLSLYTDANADVLPMATAGFGGSWMRVGEQPDQSNSANLYILVRTQHVPLEALACPGNPDAVTDRDHVTEHDWASIEQISYSYRVPWSTAPRIYEPGERTFLLGDRSPVVLKVARGERAYPEANSLNHRAEGEHLVASDGSVVWKTSPVLDNGDNVWLPRGVERQIQRLRARAGMLQGAESPEDAVDVFLAP